ncbi:unnamed protein product [Caenorhabditis sp. 36 PRJEB53466]|nr:unnamed protein product [Caenorhabditis sp. 36 PRJEB53466]
MAWIPEKYRGKEILAVVTEYLTREEGMKTRNMLACNTHWSQNFWKQATGNSDISSCTYYITHYDVDEFQVPKIKDEGIVVRCIHNETMNNAVDYDQTVFPFKRDRWMRALFEEGIGRIAYDLEGKVVGIGCVSIYPSGECVISPLYADSKLVAQMIFRSILKELLLTKKKKLWRMQVRSNDQCRESFEWIEPFLNCPLRRVHLSNLSYSIYPPKHFFDFSKIFVNAHPTNGPC